MITKKLDRVCRQRVRRLIASIRREVARPADGPHDCELRRLAAIEADELERMLAEHLEGTDAKS